MSMNIPPHIPQVIVNAAAPTTEALAKANAMKEVVPAPVQTEAIVPQKSREQDVRPPINQPSPTYDGIQDNNSETDAKVIPEDESQQQGQQEEQASGQAQDEQNNEEESNSVADENKDQQASAEKKEKEQERAQEQQDEKQIQQLKQRDAEVRAHEQAHAAIGGALAGAPSYEYQTGPDGQKYAVGGEVSIDVSKTNDPESTIRKMQTVRAAALAPAEPSSQDRKVAAQASRNIAEARADMIQEGMGASEVKDSKESSSPRVVVSSNSEQHPDKMPLAGQIEDSGQASQTEPLQAQTAKVILNRYYSSYKPEQAGFNAVA